MLSIVYILLGVAAVIWGADRFTDAASAIARRMNVPPMVIGLTVVAIGTSLPEFCVSLVSALRGTADMAVGNVVGSNIFNALLIVGAAAAVAPMSILASTVRKDIPFALFASFLLVVLGFDRYISRLDALLLLLALAAFFYYTLRMARHQAEAEAAAAPGPPLWRSLLFVVIGIACLVLGSNLFVEGATAIAYRYHVSEAVVGLTIVAGGTSLPELATSIVAARKGQSAIAIGNVLGSNVLNILFILGTAGLISPMNCSGITNVDLVVLCGSMLLIWDFSYTRYKIERWEGFALLAFFAAYLGWLLYGVLK